MVTFVSNSQICTAIFGQSHVNIDGFVNSNWYILAMLYFHKDKLFCY
jgi:hypothetical protein